MIFFNESYLGNSIIRWLAGIGIAGGVFAVGYTARYLLMKRLQAFSFSPLFLFIRQTKIFFLFFLALKVGSSVLNLPLKVERVMTVLFVSVIALQAALWANTLIDSYLSRYRKEYVRGNPDVTTFTFLGFLVKVVLITLLLLFAFNNLGINVTAMLTGLGVGGIAVALAAQNVLSDLFASLSIVFDKPFVVGDFIIVEDYMGTVEYIGLKTTRIRSLSGEQIVFSNADLLKSRIRNYQRMVERRISFNLTVGYESDLQTLKLLPAKIREIVEAQPKSRFDRAHLSELREKQIAFEVVYYVNDADYNFYMDRQQDIYFRILEHLKSSGISFGSPIQRYQRSHSL